MNRYTVLKDGNTVSLHNHAHGVLYALLDPDTQQPVNLMDYQVQLNDDSRYLAYDFLTVYRHAMSAYDNWASTVNYRRYAQMVNAHSYFEGINTDLKHLGDIHRFLPDGTPARLASDSRLRAYIESDSIDPDAPQFSLYRHKFGLLASSRADHIMLRTDEPDAMVDMIYKSNSNPDVMVVTLDYADSYPATDFLMAYRMACRDAMTAHDNSHADPVRTGLTVRSEDDICVMELSGYMQRRIRKLANYIQQQLSGMDMSVMMDPLAVLVADERVLLMPKRSGGKHAYEFVETRRDSTGYLNTWHYLLHPTGNPHVKPYKLEVNAFDMPDGKLTIECVFDTQTGLQISLFGDANGDYCTVTFMSKAGYGNDDTAQALQASNTYWGNVFRRLATALNRAHGSSTISIS